LRLAQKTIDQQHRDVQRMADHFQNLEELTPPKIKAWIDTLIGAGVTASSFERIGNGCRSFWLYLQQAGVKSMIDPDPFVGPLRLAQRTAVSNKVDRVGFTAEALSTIHAEAVKEGDQPLADLIALGAYTGARIEELCKLTTKTSSGGIFRITGSKTDAGIRECPAHPAVAPLVARLTAASEDGYLIPSTAENQYGNRSGPLSQRFGHLKKAMGFGPGHVFHSIRHTLVTLLHQAGVAKEVIADVVGHEKGNFTLDTYGSGSSHQQKLDAISKVAYGGSLGAP
jgi:integrase